MHSVIVGGRRIVQTTQVKKSMKRVEEQFITNVYAEFFGASARFGNTDDDLAEGAVSLWIKVDWKCQHVGWPVDAHELDVKLRHGLIANQGERNMIGSAFDFWMNAQELAAQI